MRRGHPLLRGRPSIDELADYPHLSISRRGKLRGPLDDVLAKADHPTGDPPPFPSSFAALVVVASSDMVTTVSERVLEHFRDTLGLEKLPLQTNLPPIAVSQAWHPRFDADPAHRWLRECVRRVCPGQQART